MTRIKILKDVKVCGHRPALRVCGPKTHRVIDIKQLSLRGEGGNFYILFERSRELTLINSIFAMNFSLVLC